MSAEKFRDLMAELGRFLKIEGLEPSADNVCNLAMGENQWMHISYSDKDEQVHWTAVIGIIPGDQTDGALRGLLAANLDWSLTQGCYFAVDDMSDAILMRNHEPIAHLHLQRMLDVTDRFTGVVEFWAANLKGVLARARAAQPRQKDPEPIPDDWVVRA